MKRFNIAIVICFVLIIVAVIFLFKKPLTSDNVIPEAVNKSESTAKTASPPTKAYVTQNNATFTQANGANVSEEKKSLAAMVGTLAAFGSSARSIDELIDYLKSAKQDPVIIEDKNEYTGSMFVVRTNSPFPGTRYFHAQYFLDESGKKFVQHMSFEFKPGPRAMQDALDTIQQSFKNLGKPAEQKADFALWNLGDGYVIWVKKQSAEDLENNTMNPSTDADIGTIRIAIEQNPHDDIDGHGH